MKINQPEPEPLTRGESNAPIRVLVVDDSDVAREAIVDYLGKLPQVRIVGVTVGGRDALTFVRKIGTDLVLMDLQMPGLNGLDTTRQLRQRHPELRVIVVSAQNSMLLPLICVDAGADGFIAKHKLPFELPLLLERLFPGRRCERKG